MARTPQVPALAGMTPLGMAAAIVDRTPTQVAKEDDRGRWFIVMGEPGFNSPANNRAGYASEAAAIAASRRYVARGVASSRRGR